MKLQALRVMLDPASKLLGDTRAVGKKEWERESNGDAYDEDSKFLAN